MKFTFITKLVLTTSISCYELVKWNSQVTKISQLSAIYASPRLFQNFNESKDTDQCFPSPKYSDKRYQLTLKSGYSNTLKFVWRDAGIPPAPPGTPFPSMSFTNGMVVITGFPKSGWASSTFDYNSRVYTLRSIFISSVSSFYVTPTPKSPNWFQIQVDFVHTIEQEGLYLIVTGLYSVGLQPSMFIDAITRKIITNSETFNTGELSLTQATRELENFRDGYYVLNNDTQTSNNCAVSWLVCNSPLQLSQYQFDILLQHLVVREPTDKNDQSAKSQSFAMAVPHACIILMVLIILF